MNTTYNKLVAKMFSISEEFRYEKKLVEGIEDNGYSTIYPINLEDVLKVIKDSDSDKAYHTEVMMIPEDEKDFIYIRCIGYNIGARWKLGIPLQNQEEETLKKLLEILS